MAGSDLRRELVGADGPALPHRRFDLALRERYTPQGAAYAVAVEAATGRVVREVVFVAAAAAEELVVTVAVDDDVRDLARRALDAAVGEGRAVRADELAADD